MRAWILPETLNLDALLVDDAPKQVTPVQPQQKAAGGGGGGGGMGRGRGRGRGRGGGGRR
jgi:small nuclear ribonucleoprotein D1